MCCGSEIMTKESLMEFIPLLGLGLTNITTKFSDNFKQEQG